MILLDGAPVVDKRSKVKVGVLVVENDECFGKFAVARLMEVEVGLLERLEGLNFALELRLADDDAAAAAVVVNYVAWSGLECLS